MNDIDIDEIEIVDDPNEVQDGAPAGFPREALEIDREVYSHMRCGRCKRKTLAFVPRHKGNVYCPVAKCWACGNVETL